MSEDRLQRRLAAILSADVAGYSRLMGMNEGETLARLKTLRREIIDPTIAAHSGRTVKLMGDGTLVEFASAVDAVTCAIEVQKRVRERNASALDDNRIEFRIGINVGDVIVDGDDIYGDGVNVAARIEALAEPGSIYVSRSAADQVRDKVPFALETLGQHSVKNIARPVEVFRVVVEARDSVSPVARDGAVRVGPLSDKPSIAVLAFNNMSGDPEQEYFSDGISEDIITDLSKLAELHVIARNSSFIYKGKPVDVKQVARELGVRFVLEGSIRKAANRVRVTAQLIDAATGGHAWAERYDRELTDIFEVQDELTRQIVGALKITLTEAEKSRLAAAGTKNVEAHDRMLKGRELIFGSGRNRKLFEQSLDCFRRAIALDPNYVAAYAGMSMAYVLDYQNGWSEVPEHSLAEADRLANEAIAKDDNDPLAHCAASWVAMFRKDYVRWADEAERAVSLNPNLALALNARATLHLYGGEPAKAIPHIERAMRLDPAQPQYIHFLGTAYFIAGDYASAATCFKDRIAANPDTDLSRAFLASALGHLGDVEEARRIWRELQAINPRYSVEEHIGRLPFKNPADAEKLAVGLRKAGLHD